MRFSHFVNGLVSTLIITLALLISTDQPIIYADSPTQICINGDCKMESGYEGYHSQRTCINDECNVDILRSNMTDKAN
jgi:hypothetical protein